MRRTLRLCCGLAAAVFLVGSHAASAATIAQYNFEEFTTTNAAWPANNGPYANSASEPGATPSILTAAGFSSLEALAVRDASHGDLDSYTLLIGAGSISETLSNSDNYLGFTVAADSTLLLNTFSFELGISNVSDVTAGTTNEEGRHNAWAQLYYSTDGGATFLAVGDVHARQTEAAPTDDFTGMISSIVDLSGLSPLSAGGAIEFRLALANDRGFNSSTGGVYIDNLVLDGTAVPEPSTIALVALSAMGLLALRRR